MKSGYVPLAAVGENLSRLNVTNPYISSWVPIINFLLSALGLLRLLCGILMSTGIPADILTEVKYLVMYTVL